MDYDLLVTNASQLLTCAGRLPKRGAALDDVGMVENGYVAVKKGRIVAVGPMADLPQRTSAMEVIDATGRCVLPGFVDAHTHVVWAGDRLAEFERRLRGERYLDILAAGGGIRSTMRATRAATRDELTALAEKRLAEMLRLGTTTVEVKSGYGLSLKAELKLLDVIERLARSGMVDIVPTFLGAHAVPPEFDGNTSGYAAHVIEEMLPAVAAWHRDSLFARQGRPLFNDVFCEQNAFTVAQTEAILAAGAEHGLPVKLHADEFTSLGGVGVALALGAISVDHLDVITAADIERLAGTSTVGVLLPAVNLNLGATHFAPARALVDAGTAVALATDINPGSAPCPSLPLVMALAARYMGMRPAETLNAVTINAAFAVGLGDEVGSLVPGKQADMLILDGSDYRVLIYELGGNRVERVIKRGAVVVSPQKG